MGIPVFVHAADLHLGAPLQQLGRNLKVEAKQLLFKLVPDAIVKLIDLTIDRKAEFLVLAGDIYDKANREPAAQLLFRRQMERLNGENIQVYIVHGNHDPTSSDLEEYVTLPSNVKVFEPNKEEVVTHQLRDGSKVLIAGISYWRVDVTENLVPRLSAVANEKTRGDARAIIGILHTNVGSDGEHAHYAPCTVSDLADSPFDYWALGHVHKRSVNEMGSHRYWAYPGNLQGRFFKEEGSKGALVVPILSTGVGVPEHVPCDVFRFAHIQIDCSDFLAADLSKEISNQCIEKIPKTGERPLVVRIRVFGISTAVTKKLQVTDSDALVVDLSETLTSYLNGGGVDRIDFDVEPEIDIQSLKNMDSILSDALKTLDEEDLISLVNDELKKIKGIELRPEQLEQIRSRIRKNLMKDLLSDIPAARL